LDDVLTGVADNAGLLSATKGHVADVIAQHELPGATLAPTSTEPGWDLVWNGSEYQIKVGTSALQRANEALEKHPQFEIISDTKTAASLNILAGSVPTLPSSSSKAHRLSVRTKTGATRIANAPLTLTGKSENKPTRIKSPAR
jgi:hypothetical protein